MKKISVIVPVYNAEKYISKCLDSILNQNYKNLELILVNDGSTDNTLDIIKTYLSDKRIKLFSNSNHGAAYSRNYGLKYATGYYVTFVDADDYIESDYMEQYVGNFDEHVDIVLGGYYDTNETKKIIHLPEDNEWSLFRYSATWGKMYKLKFIKKYNIEFGNAEFLEDVIFNLACVFKKARYKIIKYAGYDYYVNQESVSHNSGKKKEQIISIFETIKFIDEIAKKSDYKNNKYLVNYYFNTYFFMIYRCCRKSDYKFLKCNVKEFMNWMNISYPNWKKYINFSSTKEIELLNRIVINIWKGFYSLKLSNFLLYLYSL